VSQYVVELYETPSGKQVVGKEMGKLLTPNQEAHVHRQILRIEEHGRQVANDYFGRVKNSKRGIEELRLTADRVEVRFLFSVEPPNTLLLLTCYKEQSGDIPQAKIRAAEKRLDAWRARQ
jgi:hypothetical protein